MCIGFTAVKNTACLPFLMSLPLGINRDWMIECISWKLPTWEMCSAKSREGLVAEAMESQSCISQCTYMCVRVRCSTRAQCQRKPFVLCRRVGLSTHKPTTRGLWVPFSRFAASEVMENCKNGTSLPSQGSCRKGKPCDKKSQICKPDMSMTSWATLQCMTQDRVIQTWVRTLVKESRATVNSCPVRQHARRMIQFSSLVSTTGQTFHQVTRQSAFSFKWAMLPKAPGGFLKAYIKWVQEDGVDGK